MTQPLVSAASTRSDELNAELGLRLRELLERKKAVALLDFFDGSAEVRREVYGSFLLAAVNILLRLREASPVQHLSTNLDALSEPRTTVETLVVQTIAEYVAEPSPASATECRPFRLDEIATALRIQLTAATVGAHPKAGRTRSGLQRLSRIVAGFGIAAAALAGAIGFSKYQERNRLSHFLASNNSDAKALRDLQRVKEALDSFYLRHGRYPTTNSVWQGVKCCFGKSTEDWIPELVPDFLPALPREQGIYRDCAHQYVYNSDGNGYKLIRHQPDNCTLVGSLSRELVDPMRDCWAYGYWNSAGRNF